MVTYLDKVLYLHPNIERVVYWHEKCEQAPYDDAYDRLLWENTEIPKPTKEELDALDDALVTSEQELQIEIARKKARDEKYKADLNMVANYSAYKNASPQNLMTFSEYLDWLENQFYENYEG